MVFDNAMTDFQIMFLPSTVVVALISLVVESMAVKRISTVPEKRLGVEVEGETLICVNRGHLFEHFNRFALFIKDQLPFAADFERRTADILDFP